MGPSGIGRPGARCPSKLHHDTLAAAAGVVAGLADVHLAFGGAGAECPGARGVGGHFLVVTANLADEVVEGVFDVDAGLGRGFDEFAAELSGERFTLCGELVLFKVDGPYRDDRER